MFMGEVGFNNGAGQWWANAVANQSDLLVFRYRVFTGLGELVLGGEALSGSQFVWLQHAHADIDDRVLLTGDGDGDQLQAVFGRCCRCRQCQVSASLSRAAAVVRSEKGGNGRCMGTTGADG